MWQRRRSYAPLHRPWFEALPVFATCEPTVKSESAHWQWLICRLRLLSYLHRELWDRKKLICADGTEQLHAIYLGCERDIVHFGYNDYGDDMISFLIGKPDRRDVATADWRSKLCFWGSHG